MHAPSVTLWLLICVDMVFFFPSSHPIGHSVVSNEEDLSIDALTTDCLRILNHLLPDTKANKNTPIIVIGHSMGGGVAVHVANDPSIKDRIRGLIVIDVVEGTALESLGVMINVLQKRPQHFFDLEEAIDWR